MSTNPPSPNLLLLPAPSPQSPEDPSVPKVPFGADAAVKFDALGPMVVNSDGTLSRIANWENMTEAERERTMRVLVARNRSRIAKQQQDGSDASSTPLLTASEPSS